MARISGIETKPEISVRKFLFSKGFRYRKNLKNLPGRPDIVLSKYETIIFIHGCFWHGHQCRSGKLPVTRNEFWKEKIKSNIDRDILNTKKLIELGWKVLIVWQCEINTLEKRNSRLSNLAKQIANFNN